MNSDNGLPSSRATPAQDTGAGRTTLDWARDTGTTAAVLEEMERQVRLLRRRRRRLLGAAAGLIVLLVCGHTWRLGSRPPLPEAPASSTLVSAPVQQQLPDGSTAWLRAGAEIAVDFGPSVRRVELKKGEALFEVAKNPARPFIVHAAAIDVRAVGTAFSVNLDSTAVEVLVTHGEVAIERPRAADSARVPTGEPFVGEGSTAPREPLAHITAGNRIQVKTAPQLVASDVIAISGTEIDERLSWRIPKLQFSRTPLAEVVALFNQYSTVRLRLGDDSLGSLKLSGVIRADNVDALLQLLESDHGIKAAHGENEIVLRSK